jgi:hypothetical protein
MRPARTAPDPTELSGRGRQLLGHSPDHDRLPVAIDVPGGFAKVREMVPRPDPDSGEALPNSHFDTPTELVKSLSLQGFAYQGIANDVHERIVV